MHFPGVALITGAGSGIGRATAKLYARDGCTRIAIADLSKDKVDETKKQIETEYRQVSILALEADITSEGSVDEMVSEVVAVFGRIDYACNAAGVLIPGPTDEVPVALFDKQLRVNLRGTWLCQRAEIKQMLTQDPIQANDAHVPARGAIANIASMCALMAYDHLPSYCASKHGILGLCRADGLRYAKYGIRVNAICPGVIKTPMLGNVPDEDTGPDASAMMAEMAVRRFGLPEEVGECVLFVTSGRASLVTAGTLSPNGGMVGA